MTNHNHHGIFPRALHANSLVLFTNINEFNLTAPKDIRRYHWLLFTEGRTETERGNDLPKDMHCVSGSSNRIKEIESQRAHPHMTLVTGLMYPHKVICTGILHTVGPTRTTLQYKAPAKLLFISYHCGQTTPLQCFKLSSWHSGQSSLGALLLSHAIGISGLFTLHILGF